MSNRKFKILLTFERIINEEFYTAEQIMYILKIKRNRLVKFSEISCYKNQNFKFFLFNSLTR